MEFGKICRGKLCSLVICCHGSLCSESQPVGIDDGLTENVGSQMTPVSSCISSYDVSSNKRDAHKYMITFLFDLTELIYSVNPG